MQQVKKRANTQVEGDVNREHGVRAVGGQGRLQGSELATDLIWALNPRFLGMRNHQSGSRGCRRPRTT